MFEFLLFPGFSNLVLASTMEPLRDVHLRGLGAGLSWRVSSLDGQPVRSSSGLAVAPDGRFDPMRRARTLVLVAGYYVRDQLEPRGLAALRQAARSADQVIAVDTAAWILAATGLLDGQSATIHWQEFDAFQEAFPKVHCTAARHVKSGRYLSCGGASTALDMMLALIQDRFGPAAAFDAGNMFTYDLAQENNPRPNIKRLSDTASPKLRMALDVMAENIETPLTTHELAARAGLSERSLNRLFQRELGMTPGRYYRLFRLQAAHHMARETALSQEQIALRCGFSGGVALARSFQAAFGTTIKLLRQSQSNRT